MLKERPLFEVVVGEDAPEARYLTSVAKVKTVLGITGSTEDTILEMLIGQVSARCAAYCKLARGSGRSPTFASEQLRATYYAQTELRNETLVLPWRAPVTELTSVVENGITLTADVDYVLVPDNGLLQRLIEGESFSRWNAGKIVVTYTAGFANLPDEVPEDLEEQVLEQIKYRYMNREINPGIRSENVPDVYSASYSVIGGDSIGESGLMKSLESALSPYKSWR